MHARTAIAVAITLIAGTRGAGAAMAAPAPRLAEETAANREAVSRFCDLFYGQHRVRRAFETYVARAYVQHSPGIADGREAAIAVLQPMFERPDFVVHVRRILVDGDMAAVMIHVDRKGAGGGAIVDLFRLKNGKIVEHWDVNQQIPNGSLNAHALF